ncbi:hypothetical protein F511_20512 [Dorcoceras hygrometricum]|uniref:Uncharacterized protein n=1 Tax=Dorcoceras hygrometricum TaxID=472368 RepID=A0A2Z7CMA7_9LAMI|nr:hypothetical protein F511_20512 [Dorcoceras hygrometricum]
MAVGGMRPCSPYARPTSHSTFPIIVAHLRGWMVVRPRDRPAEAPLFPAWLPEEPAKANTHQGSPNRENKRGAMTQPTITRQCGIQAQRLSWPPHQNSVGPFRHDDSAGRSQRVKGFTFQKNQAQYVCMNAQQSHA